MFTIGNWMHKFDSHLTVTRKHLSLLTTLSDLTGILKKYKLFLLLKSAIYIYPPFWLGLSAPFLFFLLFRSPKPRVFLNFTVLLDSMFIAERRRLIGWGAINKSGKQICAYSLADACHAICKIATDTCNWPKGALSPLHLLVHNDIIHE